MRYEKPEVRDFGSIAEHTYTGYMGDEDDYCGYSVVDTVVIDG